MCLRLDEGTMVVLLNKGNIFCHILWWMILPDKSTEEFY